MMCEVRVYCSSSSLMTDTFDTIHVKLFVIYGSRDLSVSSHCTNIREGASPTEKLVLKHRK